MGESITHINFVRQILKWMQVNCSKNDFALVQVDLPEYKKYSKPPLVLGFYPDIFVDFDRTIIGEAKTLGDISNEHTFNQISSYIKFLKGKKRPLFIFACPWEVYEESSNLINKIQKTLNANNVEIEVIS